MSVRNPNLRNFLTGALGYLAGAAAGFGLVFLASRLGLVRWLVGLVDESQALIQALAIPVRAGLNEFSLATGNPQAVAEYQSLFEAKWQEAIPFEEAEYSTSP